MEISTPICCRIRNRATMLRKLGKTWISSTACNKMLVKRNRENE